MNSSILCKQQDIDDQLDAESAKQLLTDIWNDVGPWGDRQISYPTIRKLQTYFGYNDSEPV